MRATFPPRQKTPLGRSIHDDPTEIIVTSPRHCDSEPEPPKWNYRRTGSIAALAVTVIWVGIWWWFGPSPRRQRAAESLDALVHQLRDPNVINRRRAADDLAKVPPPADSALEPLRLALCDPDSIVRLRAARALGQLGAVALPSLLENLNSPELAVRQKVMIALREYRGDILPALPAIVAHLEETDFNLNADVRHTLVRIGAPAVPLLIEATQHACKLVRVGACETLGQMGVEAAPAIEALARCANDADETVRVIAISALSNFGVRAIPYLLLALKDSRVDVRRQSALAISRMASEADSAVTQLRDLLNDTDIAVRGHAAHALGCIGPGAKCAVPALMECLSDSNDTVRRAAVGALGQFGLRPASAIPKLLELQHDSSAIVREAATKTLQEIVQERAVVAKQAGGPPAP